MSESVNRSIIDRFARLARAMKRRVGDDHKGPFPELTLLQMQALMFIKHHPDTKVSDLATQMGISASSASLLVDRLVAGEYLKRLNDPTDRRIVTLQVEEKIKTHFKEIWSAQLTRLDTLLEKLTLADRRELDRILGQIEESL